MSDKRICSRCDTEIPAQEGCITLKHPFEGITYCCSSCIEKKIDDAFGRVMQIAEDGYIKIEI